MIHTHLQWLAKHTMSRLMCTICNRTKYSPSSHNFSWTQPTNYYGDHSSSRSSRASLLSYINSLLPSYPKPITDSTGDLKKLNQFYQTWKKQDATILDSFFAVRSAQLEFTALARIILCSVLCQGDATSASVTEVKGSSTIRVSSMSHIYHWLICCHSRNQ